MTLKALWHKAVRAASFCRLVAAVSCTIVERKKFRVHTISDIFSVKNFSRRFPVRKAASAAYRLIVVIRFGGKLNSVTKTGDNPEGRESCKGAAKLCRRKFHPLEEQSIEGVKLFNHSSSEEDYFFFFAGFLAPQHGAFFMAFFFAGFFAVTIVSSPFKKFIFPP